ncbi:hypothetical protein BHM03_00033157 [Ensete ventricosum]|nr:hypothetical protein BHM03_00033157 [Ensete ventricosum]
MARPSVVVAGHGQAPLLARAVGCRAPARSNRQRPRLLQAYKGRPQRLGLSPARAATSAARVAAGRQG